MENNTSPPTEPTFNKPVSIFEAIALENKEDKPKEAELPKEKEEEKKEKSRGEFLFPITMLF